MSWSELRIIVLFWPWLMPHSVFVKKTLPEIGYAFTVSKLYFCPRNVMRRVLKLSLYKDQSNRWKTGN